MSKTYLDIPVSPRMTRLGELCIFRMNEDTFSVSVASEEGGCRLVTKDQMATIWPVAIDVAEQMQRLQQQFTALSLIVKASIDGIETDPDIAEAMRLGYESLRRTCG